ncbi:MAG: DUF4926 domain-containing protein [Cytophagaceae bacterium]|nr:DUF4926 domain-containing protein [Cytophagaceae bacterium]
MNTSIQELEEAVLLDDLPEKGLVKGDVGVVVHVYANAIAYEVEFMTKDGHTVAVETLEANQVRAVQPNDLWQVRVVSEAAYGAPQSLDRISAFSGLLDEARKLYFFFPFYSLSVPHCWSLIPQ